MILNPSRRLNTALFLYSLFSVLPVTRMSAEVEQPQTQREVDYEAVRRRVDSPDALIVDVREPAELERTGRIPSSINIPCVGVEKIGVGVPISTNSTRSRASRRVPPSPISTIFEGDATRTKRHLSNVAATLGAATSEEDFRQRFERSKPPENTEIIFYCMSGRRSAQALSQALQLGYKNSKTYVGSWQDWSNHNQ